MACSVERPELSHVNPSVVCRGCLKDWGEMKNMYQAGLDVDFFRYTDIPRIPSEGLPELLCSTCEVDLTNTKKFRVRCQESDKILKLNLNKKTNARPAKPKPEKVQVTSVLSENKITFTITAPNPADKIPLKCPFEKCTLEFQKTIHLKTHLEKAHNLDDCQIEQQYFCTEPACVYNKNSNPRKFFTGRKFLNQHTNKAHKDKVYMCEACQAKFPTEAAYYRHLRSCNMTFSCETCQLSYTTNEAYIVHLLRKHPDLHAQYKQQKKAQKRTANLNNNINYVPPKVIKFEPKKTCKTKKPVKVEAIKEETENDSANVTTIIELELKLEEDDGQNDDNAKIAAAEQNLQGCENDAVKDAEPIEITRFPPWDLNADVFETTIPLSEDQPDIESADIEQNEGDLDSITEVQDTLVVESIEECFEETIEHEETVIDEESKTHLDNIDSESIDDGKGMLEFEGDCFGQKKTSATQVPEHITNDVSLNSWDNKNDFEIQTDDMSTQTVFEDLLRSQQDDIFFSESVSLSDIQTQTTPLEFGLTQNHKGTQSQSPGLSFKGTQTSLDLYDFPKRNFKIFDSRSSSPGFISNAQTQTTDARFPVRSDVMLSFSSAETQTYCDDFRYASM